MSTNGGREEFIMDFLGVRHQESPDGSLSVTLQTTRGEISGVLHASQGHTGAVLFGSLRGPADALFEALSPELAQHGVSAYRIQFRQRGDLPESVGDMLAGLSFLRGIGAQRVAVVGASFGGAVAIRAGILSPLVVAVATLASQTYGAQDVAQLAPKPILITHGTADNVLGHHNAENIYSWAGEPKELVLYPGAGHDLRACREQLHDKLLAWLTDQVG